MCGIVGYIGGREAFPILIKGLQRLEYRGYDSAGTVMLDRNEFKLYKKEGKVADLLAHVGEGNVAGTVGIGHTRWATHGAPSDRNSHPHVSNSGRYVMIHNGIIENYASLKKELSSRGYVFHSDTDTEVLINLMEDLAKNSDSFGTAFQHALQQVVGAYAIVVIDREDPDTLYAAKMGSPLVIGLGEEEFFIASDATPFLQYTKDAVYLDEGEMAIIQRSGEMNVRKIDDGSEIAPEIHELQMNIEAIEKGGYDHFMLKEIYEQSKAIRDTLRGRLLADRGVIQMSGIKEYEEKFLNAHRLIIVACGTSWHSGLVGEYLFEDLARIPVEVEYASEFRYRNPVITENDVVIAISQSGETADTLAAMRLAREKGATLFGICNVVGSSIARESDAGAYTHAGPEIGVASTKAFTTQLTVLTLMALYLGHKRGVLDVTRYHRLLHELDGIPEGIDAMLKSDAQVTGIAKIFSDAHNFLYLGRGYNFPIALEGALKLKEISYIHAEGYPAAEMKHGPIALIDENMPVVVIATKRGHYEKVVSNIEEVKSRNGKIIAIINEGDETLKELADYYVEIPPSEEMFSPLFSVVPLQLLAYHIAINRGCNVDQPRNLAKSVTVE
jgi:glucosamine--fructose-6-phosphate aminotransferase (isomerizing)